MSENWYLLESGLGSAVGNMAADEALFEAGVHLRQPVLRFYGWREAAATFGYSQKYAEVAQWTDLRPLIRRPTGGGLVLHDADWTYSMAIPPNHDWHAIKAVESYQRMHEWIRTALTSMGISTVLSRRRQKEAPGRCFVGAEEFDLLCGDEKIAGAAQRRNRHGLLIQGSVQVSRLFPELKKAEWQRAMTEVFPLSSKVTWAPLDLDNNLRRRISELTRDKYAQPAYNERR
jgi:lipoate-protein ligase A